MRDACEAPLRQIVANGGGAPDIVAERVKRLKGNMGFDARTEKYCDLVECGIIDPAKVVKSAIRHSASVACSLLSIGAVMTFYTGELMPASEQSSLLF
jgi:chaperonin GroEL